jgi:hypothetical protein
MLLLFFQYSEMSLQQTPENPENKLGENVSYNMLIFWTLSIVLVFKTQRFRDWIFLRQVQWKRLAFSMGPNTVGPLPLFYSPDDGDRSSLWNSFKN